MWQRDLKDAYRQILVNPADWFLQGLQINNVCSLARICYLVALLALESLIDSVTALPGLQSITLVSNGCYTFWMISKA